MNSLLSFSVFLTLLGCLLLGALYAWALYSASLNLHKTLRTALGVLRTLAVGMLAFLLFAPLVKRVSYTPEKPIIVIANDNSLSVKEFQPANFDFNKYQVDLNKLADKLSEKYEVRSYHFGDSVKQGLSFSGTCQATNGAALVNRLNDELLNRNVGAVIIASDGIFNRGGNPLYELDKINAPVYTVALGDTIPKKDALIANVNYNNLVYLDNEFTLDIQVQAFQSKGEVTQLSVLENGRKVAQQNVILNTESFVKDLPVKLKANRVGIHQYTVQVSTLSNEITTKNNNQTIYIEVIDGRQKILLASAVPHPDLATFKQAISRHKNYEVTLAIGDELNQLDLNAYSMAILYQLPAQGGLYQSFLKRVEQQKIAVWYVLGVQSDLQAFNKLQKQVSFNGLSAGLQEVFPIYNQNFSTFTLDPTAINQFAIYAPLQTNFSTVVVQGNYSALLYQRIGRVNTQNPQLFFMIEDGRKRGFLIGEGIWRWQLEEGKNESNYPLVGELIAKSVQYLSVSDDKRKFKVYASKSSYEENENIRLNATLYNDALESVNAPEVKLVVKNEQAKSYHFTFSKFGTGYQLDAGALPQGNYKFIATTQLGGKQHTASGAFFVAARRLEYQQTTANHQLLNTLAHQTNGKMYMPTDLHRIAKDLENSGQVKTITYEDRKYEEMINFKWIFALIVGLLTVEWFFRKRNGEI